MREIRLKQASQRARFRSQVLVYTEASNGPMTPYLESIGSALQMEIATVWKLISTGLILLILIITRSVILRVVTRELWTSQEVRPDGGRAPYTPGRAHSLPHGVI